MAASKKLDVKTLTDEQLQAWRALTALQQKMVSGIAAGLTPAQAHCQARNYSATTPKEKDKARMLGNQVLSNPNVRGFLEDLNKEVAEQVKIDATFVLERAMQIHERCMQNIKPIDKEGSEVDGLYVFDSKGALAALKMIGDHRAIQAFQLNIKAEVEIKDLTNEELDKKLAKLLGNS